MVKRNPLPIPVLTSVVTILPITANNNVGLRLELYGCKGGYYFVAWLMLKETLFSVAHTDPSNYEYEEVTVTVVEEIRRILGTSRGFLHARIINLSPQKSTSLATMVTAMVEIHCLRSSEQVLLANLKTALEEFETVFEPSYIKFQFPKRCGCTPLRVRIKLRKTMKTAEEYRLSQMLRFPVELENSCQSSGSKFYSWTVSKIDKETGLFGPLLEFGKKDRFFLPLRMMRVGYAYIQCLVEISGNTGSIAYDYGYIRVVRDPLQAHIIDISESSSKIILSAKESLDTGSRRPGTQGLRFAWFCRLVNETFSHEIERVVDKPLGRNKSNSGCLGFGPGRLTSRNEVLTLDITDMIKSEMYVFKLMVEKDFRNASAVYEFTVKPAVSISIRCLSNCGEKVTPQDDLLLEAHCAGHSCDKVSRYKWSFHLVNQEDLSVQVVHHLRSYSQMNGQRFLMEDISKLRDDSNKQIIYVVKAIVQLDKKTKFEGRFPFLVNSPPNRTSNTSCHVTPMEGEAISTDFLITCSGWNDEDKPLVYEFRYQDKHGMVLIQTGPLNRVITKLPVGKATEDYSLVLEAQVGDSFKDFVETRLLVKVRPPKQSELNDGLVEKQLSVIRDFVQAGDANRATELAFMLMSTVKDFSDGSFEEKSGAILQDMKGIKVNSVVHVTKVAAVVAWATENRRSVPMSLQTDALTLLTEATDFMAIQFTSNSTHDTKLAKNVSSGLLNSIGSVLQISSRDAKVETKDNFIKEKGRETTMKTLDLVRKVGEVLYSTGSNRQNKTVVKSNFVDIIIYEEKPKDLSGKSISEGGASVAIPDSKDIFPNANESVTIQMMAFKENTTSFFK
ncbi:sperm receptor for egg jelly-like [Stylophora pistillata]|uniref:sperm receptor for egg jelly-like n=1 Tax=Stylophora pistillata TaxID=50429 RepID=UPI000C0575FB|nr:sperm receptor for egg jelly-like [Stylophora pistillata]